MSPHPYTSYRPRTIFIAREFICFFLLILTASPALAWNEDFNPENRPSQRTVCVKETKGVFQIRSTPPDEACFPNEGRFLFVIGREPKGSLAFLPLKSYSNFYPPWVPSWPVTDENSNPRLWHFTCMAYHEKEILGTKIKQWNYQGEITAPASDQSCESAYTMAQNVCLEKLGGNEIYEQCIGSLGWFDF